MSLPIRRLTDKTPGLLGTGERAGIRQTIPGNGIITPVVSLSGEDYIAEVVTIQLLPRFRIVAGAIPFPQGEAKAFYTYGVGGVTTALSQTDATGFTPPLIQTDLMRGVTVCLPASGLTISASYSFPGAFMDVIAVIAYGSHQHDKPYCTIDAGTIAAAGNVIINGISPQPIIPPFGQRFKARRSGGVPLTIDLMSVFAGVGPTLQSYIVGINQECPWIEFPGSISWFRITNNGVAATEAEVIWEINL